MSRDSLVYIKDILEAVNKIEKYTKGFSYENFKKNNLVIDAVLRNLGIIGEAVKNVSLEVI